jgi:NAD(P)-dependent dehydrogenase (short-subunit alcohol dehydrogenase family)
MNRRIVVVTGSSGLIGEAVSCKLHHRGCVVYTVDIQPSRNSTRHLNVDLCSSEAADELSGFISEIESPFTVLHCAGLDFKDAPSTRLQGSEGSIRDSAAVMESVEAFCSVANSNINMTYLVIHTAVRRMLATGGGSILLLGSVYGQVAPDQRLYANDDGSIFMAKPFAYSVSKSTFGMFAKLIAANFAASKIQCNNVALHAIIKDMSKQFESNFLKMSPTPYTASLSSISDFLVYLCTFSPPYLNGSTILVDGGWSSR